MVAYDVNGFTLADPAGRWWVTAEGSSHSPAVNVRAIDSVLPGRTGILPPARAELREAATLNLRVMVASRDAVVRESRWEAVKALFVGTTFTIGRTVGAARRTSAAKLKSISEPDLTAKAGVLVGVITVTLLDGAFHSAPAIVTFPLTVAGAIVDVPAASGTGPVEDWWARVNGPATSVVIRTVIDGDVDSTRLSAWAGSKQASTRVFLRAHTAWTSASDGWSEPATPNAHAGASSGAAGPLVLIPQPVGADPMVRRAQIHIQGAGVDGTTEITIRAGATWV